MSGEFPSFETPYVEVEQVIQGLKIQDRQLFSFYVDAAISLVQGKSRSQVQSELVSKGLAPEKAQEIVQTVQRRKKWKVRWNGIRTLLYGLFLLILGIGGTLFGILLGLIWFLPLFCLVPVGGFKVVVGICRILAA